MTPIETIKTILAVSTILLAAVVYVAYKEYKK